MPLARIAALVMVGKTLADQKIKPVERPGYYSVKESVFPFIKFPGVDTLLGPEMKSTGEVMGVGKSFGEAFNKATLATGEKIPHFGLAFISVRDIDKPEALELAKQLDAVGFSLCATHGTAKVLVDAGLECAGINKVREGQPHVVDMLKNHEIDLIINTTEGKRTIADSYSIRRTALQYKVFYLTTIAAAKATVHTMQGKVSDKVYCLQELHRGVLNE